MAKRLCPGCDRRVPADPDKHIFWRDTTWHRICQMKESAEFDTIDRLFHMQEPDVDPTTAMADLIGQLGHFAEAYSKGKRGDKRIDFEDAVRRGLNYWRDER